MFKWLKNLLTPPTLDRRTDGYNFAKEQLKIGKQIDLENFVDSAKVFGGFDDFDRGIEDALREPSDA